MTAQAMLWTLAGTALGVAISAGVADWLRARRRDLDRPGWVPWTGIQLAAGIAALVAAALALKAG
jgi:hypothetical protein